MLRLLEALPADWYCVVIGDPGSNIRFRDQFAAQVGNLADPANAARLRWLAPDPRTAEVMRGFDVLVCCSTPEHESFGLTMAEGIALGVPVVSPPVGLAAIEPSLTYQVPLDPTGPELAVQVLEAFRCGPRPGSRDFIYDRASFDRFGRECRDLLPEVLGPDPDTTARVWGAVETCPDGQSGPCGCLPGPPRICTEAGSRVEVRRDHCFQCQLEKINRVGQNSGLVRP